ncbi:MAG: VWA domain-containing protein [Synergistaceae bacterium]|nr:VWA domain-containing protein [Synergistaceae bacterium]
MTRKFCAVMAMLVLSIVFCGQASAAKNADIVFFIDSSGSMQNDIDGVRTNLAAFSRSMASSDVDARFAIVEYQTRRGIVVHKPNGTDTWTSDTSQVETVLASITADDGDGYTMNAINEVFSWGDFRSDASRFGFMLTDVMRLNNDYGDDVWIDDTDAASEDISTISTLMESTVQQLNSMGMNMSVVSTPGLRSPYQSLYSQTGGVFIDITTSDYYRSMLDMAQWISEEVSTENPLPHALIQGVPDEILNYVGEDGETVLQRIAKLANISVDQINVITEQSLDLRLPHEPTEAMRQKANGEFIAKLDTLVLSFDSIPDGEEGYFLFQLEIPDEVLSMDLNPNDLRLWYATPDEFTSASSEYVFRPSVFDPFTYFEITDLLGYEANTLAKKVLVLVFASAGKSLSMWLLKILLFAAGCNSAAIAEIGATGVLSVGAFVLLRKIFRKR